MHKKIIQGKTDPYHNKMLAGLRGRKIAAGMSVSESRFLADDTLIGKTSGTVTEPPAMPVAVGYQGCVEAIGGYEYAGKLWRTVAACFETAGLTVLKPKELSIGAPTRVSGTQEREFDMKWDVMVKPKEAKSIIAVVQKINAASYEMEKKRAHTQR